MANIDLGAGRVVAASAPPIGYLDWGPIIGGALVATAYSSLMTVFGSAIGLSMTSAWPNEGASGKAIAIASGLWMVWVMVSGFAAGGYFAGRLRRRLHDATESESDLRDGAHGAVVWAIGVLLGAWLAASSVAGVASVAARAGATATGAGAATIAATTDIGGGVDRLLRGNAATPQSADLRGDFTRLMTAAAAGAAPSADDRAYMARIVAERAGIPQADAEKRVDAALVEARQMADKARAAAETARRTGVLVAFLTAATLLVSLAAAAAAAILGGNHRDENTSFASIWTW